MGVIAIGELVGLKPQMYSIQVSYSIEYKETKDVN